LLPGQRGERRLLAVASVLLGAAVIAHAARYGTYIDDDAGITFGYAKSWAAGRGLEINPGDAPVEGYSNPSWTFLLALFVRAGLFHWVWTPKLLGGLFALGTLALSAVIAAQLTGRRLSLLHLLAPALLVANASFVVWAVAGLENGLYAFLVLALLSAWLARRTPGPWLGVLAFVTTISRPEAVGYAGLVALGVVVDAVLHPERRRPALVALGTGVGLLAVYAGWHAATFADPLPNTWYAKGRSGSLLVRLLRTDIGGWRYLRLGISEWHLGWAVAAAVAVLVLPNRWARGVPIALAAGAWGPLAIILTSGDWMMEFRFLSPTYALLATLATPGLVSFRARLAGAGGGWVAGRVPAAAAVAGVGAIAVAAWAWSAAPFPERSARVAAKPTMPLANTRRGPELYLEIAARLELGVPVVLQGAMGDPPSRVKAGWCGWTPSASRIAPSPTASSTSARLPISGGTRSTSGGSTSWRSRR
jgi:hypothetical protein